jgi:outer membrane protein, multidrug efflux system
MNNALKQKIMVTSVGALIIFFAGCAAFRPEPRVPNRHDIPQTFTLYDPVDKAPGMWWVAFESDELNRLMEMAFEGNLSLRQAYARLDQSRAATLKAGASLVPGLDATGAYSVSTRETYDGLQGGTTRQFSAGLSVPAYELDIWGRVRSARQAARMEYQMSAEDIRSVYMTVSAEIANRWLEYLYYSRVNELLQEQLESNRQSLELIEARFRLGQSTALDVYQQRQVIASVESLQPEIDGRLAELRNEIAIMVGKPAGTDVLLTADTLPEIKLPPNPGIPADVLSARPDVRRAGLALEASDWRVAAARADRLPSLRLTGSFAYSSDEIGTLFDNWVSNLAASLVGPVFDAGRRRYEVDRARAAVDERLAVYRETVLNAVMEVQNTLIRWSSQKKTLEAQERQLSVAQDTYRESMSRYRSGAIDYLPVLTALSQSQQLERSLLQTRYRHLLTHVSLLRSLGGDWMEQKIPIETTRTEMSQDFGYIKISLG